MDIGIDTEIRKKYNKTPLSMAIEYDRIKAVQYLVEETECDINQKNNGRDYPIVLATKLGSVKIVRYLLQKGAKADIDILLWIAKKKKYLDIVEYLQSVKTNR
jgi:ankyrin repeat protein